MTITQHLLLGSNVPTRRGRPKLPPKSVARKFKAECFVIGIDGFFLDTSGNWTEEPAFAKKCGKANVLDGVVRDLKLAHTDRNVRLLRCKQTFTITEVE